MLYVRYQTAGLFGYGQLDGEVIRPIVGDLFGDRNPTGQTVPLAEATLLRPVDPPKILCIGLNYQSHLHGRPAPTHPEIFYKPRTALVDPEGEIRIPRDSKDLHFEGELVVVIGTGGSDLSGEEAEEAILGYTCGNDVSERNWQKGSKGDQADKQWWRAKGSDTFGPLGPALAVGLDWANCRIQTRLNGEVKQSQMLSDLLFKPAEAVSFISRYVTLEPGDVIYTGTPGSTSPMQPGDVVEVDIEGIGVLRNHVVGPKS